MFGNLKAFSLGGRKLPLLLKVMVVTTFYLKFSGAWADTDPFSTMVGGMSTAAQNVAGQMVAPAFNLMGLLFVIQFTLRNYKLVLETVTGGEFVPLFSKIFFAALWIGFLTYLINNNYNVLNAIFSSFQMLAGKASGGVSMDPGSIAMEGIALQDNLQASFNAATGSNDSMMMAIKNILPALLLALACLGIMLSFFVMAVAVAIATLEFYLILAAAPIAYATGALDAMKQSGTAPLQSVLSVGYRILILGVIIGIVHKETSVWDNSFSTMTANNWDAAWVALLGAGLGAVAAFHSGKIASALASGQSSLTGNDAMAAGLTMMNTIANTTAATAAGVGALAAGMAAAKGMGGAGMDAAAKGFTTMRDAFGPSGGTMSGGGGGGGGGSGGGAGGSGGSEARAANEAGLGEAASGREVSQLLGPVSSDLADVADDGESGASSAGESGTGSQSGSNGGQARAHADTGGASGNAEDAGIGSPDGSQSSASGSGGGGGNGSGDPVLDEVKKLQQQMAKQKPSNLQTFGRSALKQMGDMQLNDTGHVGVQVNHGAGD